MLTAAAAGCRAARSGAAWFPVPHPSGSGGFAALLDQAVETLDHAVRRGNGPPDRFLIRLTLRVLRRGQAMLDAEVGAQLIELVLAGGGPFAQTEQVIGELLAARHWARTNGAFNGSLGENGPDLHRTGPFEIAQEPAGIGGSLGAVDADEDPAGRPPLGDAMHHLPGNGSIATNR